MKKQLLSVFAMLLSLLLLVSSIPLTATAATSGDALWIDDAQAFDQTDNKGTSEDNPIEISSAEQLAYLAEMVNAGTSSYEGMFFKQTADIDLAGKLWTPIGTSDAPFSGNYNGGGYTISNLHVNESSMDGSFDNAGLFGYVNGGTGTTTITIENLSVIGGEIKSNEVVFAEKVAGDNSTRVAYSGFNGLYKAGVIAADAVGVTLNNVYTDVDIYPSYQSDLYAGGLIGNCYGQIEIIGCAAMGDIAFSHVAHSGVTGNDGLQANVVHAGGLVGSALVKDVTGTTRSMTGSFYTGTISITCASNNMNTRIGGLAGAWMNSATIDSCYMLGSVDVINTSTNPVNGRIGTVVGSFGGGNATGTTVSSSITKTKLYNQYEVSNAAYDKNYFYVSQPTGWKGDNNTVTVSTITGGTNNPITLRSYQYSTTDADAFRLLATISTLDYQDVGYTVTAVEGELSGTWGDHVSGVYETIVADGKECTATDANIGGNAGDYIVALLIDGVPDSGVVAMEVAPYVITQSGEKIYGNTVVLIFNNGKMMNCYGLQNDKEADRITALGTDLSNFKIVYDGTKTSGSHVAAADLYRLILKNFGIGLDVEKKATSASEATHLIYLQETGANATDVDNYGNWAVEAVDNTIYIKADDICGFSAGVSRVIEKMTADTDKNVTANELAGSGSLQSRADYDNGETANGNFAAFKPVYTLPYTITNAERTLSYHKGLLDDPDGQTVIYAHRGEHTYYPEASLEAYISAWYSGASIVDVDIQQTADGVWVCMHNTTLNATTNVETEQPNNPLLAEREPDSDGKYYLKDWTYAELQQLSLMDSYGQVTTFKIPTLVEVLKACEGNVYVGLDDKTKTYTNPETQLDFVSKLTGAPASAPAGLMLRGKYNIINSNNTYSGVTLPGIVDEKVTIDEDLAKKIANSTDDVTNLMIPASNPDYYRYRENTTEGNAHLAIMPKYKDQVRFFTWMMYDDNDTPAVWAEAESHGYDTLGTNYCIAMMEHIKSSQK